MNKREQFEAWATKKLGKAPLKFPDGTYCDDRVQWAWEFAALSAPPHDNNAPVSVHSMLEPTHICKDCGAPWRQCDDFTFNLRGEKACPACDNAPVGGQLISITAPMEAAVRRLVDIEERRRKLLERVLRCGLCEEPHGVGFTPSRQERIASELARDIVDELRGIDALVKS